MYSSLEGRGGAAGSVGAGALGGRGRKALGDKGPRERSPGGRHPLSPLPKWKSLRCSGGSRSSEGGGSSGGVRAAEAEKAKMKVVIEVRAVMEAEEAVELLRHYLCKRH